MNTNQKITAKKSLGQNFLVNQGVLEKISVAAEVGPEDTVLEIGPGRGVLTENLAQKAKRVVTVEKDHRLIEPLQQKFSAYSHVEIVELDVLTLKPEDHSLIASAYKIVANIPYYITSNLLRIIFEKWPKPITVVLMVQKEVAHRICATTGDHSLLSLSVQYYAQPKIVSRVSRGSFRPVPNVDSAILKLTPIPTTLDSNQEKTFFKLIKAGFAHKRKMLLPVLGSIFPANIDMLAKTFEQLSISPKERPQNLALDTWLELAKSLNL